MRLATALAVAAFALAGCGADDVRDRAADVREQAERLVADVDSLRDRADELREDARGIRERVRRRVREVLEEIERTVPRASLPEPRTQGETTEIGAFLTETLRSIDIYWTRTLKGAGLPEPRVGYAWVPVPTPSARARST